MLHSCALIILIKNDFKYLSLRSEDFLLFIIDHEHETPVEQTHKNICRIERGLQGSTEAENDCFEIKRINISLHVLKFPSRNPTVLLVFLHV